MTRQRLRSHNCVFLWLIALIVIILAETFVFNLAFWRTFHHDSVSMGKPIVGKGLVQEDEGGYKIIDPDTAWIEIPVKSDLGVPRIESIHMLPTANGVPLIDDINAAVHYKVELEVNNQWVDSASGIWRNAVNDNLGYTRNSVYSQYALIPNIATNNVRIYFTDTVNTIVDYSNVIINPTVPITINWNRIVTLLLISAIVIAFRPKSTIYKKTLNLCNRHQYVILSIIPLVYCIIFILLCLVPNETPKTGYESAFGHWVDRDQYQYLGDAFLHGRLNLDLPVDEKLKNMPNPYNFVKRRALGQDGSVIYWDHAFYDGKYYTYFGALPALLLYAPYQAITGHWLSNALAITLMGVIFIILISLLVIRIADKYFHNQVSVGLVMLAMLIAPLGSNLAYYGFMRDFYSIPILASSMFTIAGLLCWSFARTRFGKLSSVRIFAGSLLMALNLGCRPQFLVACLLAFPMFWNEITKTRELFSLKGFKPTICAFMPFILVAIPWMWYNNARFGSPLDIGANYNLTAFDMTKEHPSKFAIPIMLFTQLFQTPSMIGAFPFISAIHNIIPVPSEPSLGGYFMIVPFALTGLLFPFLKTTLKKHGVYGFVCVLLISTFIVAIVDVSMTGITNRYHGDFAYMTILLSIIVAYALQTELSISNSTQSMHMLYAILLALILFSMFIYGAGCFATSRYSAWIRFNPDLFYDTQSWFLGFNAGQGHVEI